jgi:hypothetical protein
MWSDYNNNNNNNNKERWKDKKKIFATFLQQYLFDYVTISNECCYKSAKCRWKAKRTEQWDGLPSNVFDIVISWYRTLHKKKESETRSRGNW